MSEKLRNQTEQILHQLKQELELKDLKRKCEQWVLGISINDEGSVLIARVAVAVSDTDLVDGMDIVFTVADKNLLMDADYWEQAPDFEGGTVEGALDWLMKGGSLVYFSVQPPENYCRTFGETDGQV